MQKSNFGLQLPKVISGERGNLAATGQPVRANFF
jgi:hypothetical protein